MPANFEEATVSIEKGPIYKLKISSDLPKDMNINGYLKSKKIKIESSENVFETRYEFV